jgi:hypothetical protein
VKKTDAPAVADTANSVLTGPEARHRPTPANTVADPTAAHATGLRRAQFTGLHGQTTGYNALW